MPPLPMSFHGGSPLQCHKDRWRNGCGAEECLRATQVVFFRGKIPCSVLFIGEGPGESEDTLGLPFKGPAGELLQRIIDNAVPAHVRWAITNVVGCIPRDTEGLKSGEPSHDQIQHCKPRLEEFVRIADPKLIVCVGTVARDYLDPKYNHAAQLHKPIVQVHILHPAAILRSTIAVRGLQVQRCVVQVSNAVQHMLDGTGPFAPGQTQQEETGLAYTGNEDDIPF